ncbi:MAG: hypothetical protein CEN90_241 [Parcubacteria group bacterium Licking1014_17]|nr:MAG: hypothetical protein CEN90_241 [Parcubacteria group bacterium Licking1014_17]
MLLPQPTIPSWVFTLGQSSAPRGPNFSGLRTDINLPNIFEPIINFFRNIGNFFHLDLTDPDLIATAKKVAIAFIIFFIFVLVYLFFRIRAINKAMGEATRTTQTPPAGSDGAPAIMQTTLKQGSWEAIKAKAQSYNEAEWKIAVIEADKFVDDALKAAGYQGETMGERLILIKPGNLVSLQELWDAHKLRNLIVHDAGFSLKHNQAVVAVNVFEKVLKEISAVS